MSSQSWREVLSSLPSCFSQATEPDDSTDKSRLNDQRELQGLSQLWQPSLTSMIFSFLDLNKRFEIIYACVWTRHIVCKISSSERLDQHDLLHERVSLWTLRNLVYFSSDLSSLVQHFDSIYATMVFVGLSLANPLTVVNHLEEFFNFPCARLRKLVRRTILVCQPLTLSPSATRIFTTYRRSLDVPTPPASAGKMKIRYGKLLASKSDNFYSEPARWMRNLFIMGQGGWVLGVW